MDPGPDNNSVLTLQANHRSTPIWEGQVLANSKFDLFDTCSTLKIFNLILFLMKSFWKECGPLVTRCHLKGLLRFRVHPAVLEYVSETQFNGASRLCYVALDPDLITALVERWREETHTFHLPFGEATITLQDVNVLFGLRITGRPVTGSNNFIWADLLEEHLGLRPPREELDGQKLKLTWLRDNFSNPPVQADGSINEIVLHRYVRAYLLYLIGAVLFPDKSGNKVQMLYFPLLIDLTRLHEISWGSGVLAYLYRNLCTASKKGVTQIAGPLLLLQFWSWERISIGRPKIVRAIDIAPLEEGIEYPMGMSSQMRYGSDPLGCKWLRIDRSYHDHRLGLVVYRDAFDRMKESQFVWMPYTPNVLQQLGPICSEDEEEWIVMAPLICFEAVEWHLPNRCVRQFGWHQEVPPLCNTSVALHRFGRRGVGVKDFAVMHAENIVLWGSRKTRMLQEGIVYAGLMHYNDEYLRWYRSITRRQVSPPQASTIQDYDNRHYYAPTSTDYDSLVSFLY